LLIAKDLMSKGVDRGKVANAVKLRYRDQEPFLAAARRADTQSLTHAIQHLAAADLAIKTSKGGGGPVAARLQIEMLVCELALMQCK
jgi:DNA polymerase III delta subunit